MAGDRLTHQTVEIVSTGNPASQKVRITQQIVEVIAPPTFPVSLTESASAAETITAAIILLDVEAASATDSQIATASFHVSVIEALTAAETMSTGAIWTDSIHDTIFATDVARVGARAGGGSVVLVAGI